MKIESEVEWSGVGRRGRAWTVEGAFQTAGPVTDFLFGTRSAEWIPKWRLANNSSDHIISYSDSLFVLPPPSARPVPLHT